jgi:hypothetical protein
MGYVGRKFTDLIKMSSVGTCRDEGGSPCHILRTIKHQGSYNNPVYRVAVATGENVWVVRDVSVDKLKDIHFFKQGEDGTNSATP